MRIIYAPPLVTSQRVSVLDSRGTPGDTCGNQSDMSDCQAICVCSGLLIRYTAGPTISVKREKGDSHVF